MLPAMLFELSVSWLKARGLIQFGHRGRKNLIRCEIFIGVSGGIQAHMYRIHNPARLSLRYGHPYEQLCAALTPDQVLFRMRDDSIHPAPLELHSALA